MQASSSPMRCSFLGSCCMAVKNSIAFSQKAISRCLFPAFPVSYTHLDVYKRQESGCGKSTTAMGIMQLIKKPGRIAGGAIHFDGKDLLQLSADEMTEVRGKKIGIIFQNPLDSLNPVYTVGYQMTEGLLVDKMDKKEAYQLACDMLRDVKISDVEERMKTYPHEISGGMRQRLSLIHI